MAQRREAEEAERLAQQQLDTLEERRRTRQQQQGEEEGWGLGTLGECGRGSPTMSESLAVKTALSSTAFVIIYIAITLNIFITCFFECL